MVFTPISALQLLWGKPWRRNDNVCPMFSENLEWCWMGILVFHLRPFPLGCPNRLAQSGGRSNDRPFGITINIYGTGGTFVCEEVTAYTLGEIHGKDRWCGWGTGLGQCHPVAMAAVLVGGVDSRGDAKPEDR